MKPKPQSIQNIYLNLMLFNTLAASFIWGINTLFLLDAGLTNLQAFAANAFFTAGQVLFEVPTGIIADTWGRRTSYLLGTLTLGVSTFLYFLSWQLHAPFWAWVVTSVLLGLGFTFFSGATEAWLVDALEFTGFKGTLESVFAKGQIVGGIAMLAGSVAGGYIAQITDLGVPYILRAAVLGLTFVIAFLFMKDLGFSPKKSKHPFKDMRQTFVTSLNFSVKNAPFRWVMIGSFFTMGVSFYAFYAMQPYLLELYGDKQAYGIAGLAAAIAAGAQVCGGFVVPHLRRIFHKRTTILLGTLSISTVVLIGLAVTSNFWVALGFLVIFELMFAANMPVRQAYMNALIPSKERATIISFDALVGSSGGVVVQPILGRVADVWSYAASYLGVAAFQALAVPFIYLARKQNSSADPIHT